MFFRYGDRLCCSARATVLATCSRWCCSGSTGHMSGSSGTSSFLNETLIYSYKECGKDLNRNPA